MPRKWQKTLWLLLCSLLVVALFYRFRGTTLLGGFSWQKLGASLANTDIPLLLLAAAGIYVSYAVRALRWKRFSRYMGRPTFWNVYSATIMGYAAVFILGRAGEPVRPLLIARKDQLSIPGSFGVYVLERVYDIGATAMLAVCALLALPSRAVAGSEKGPLFHDARIAGWILLGLLAAFIVILIYFRLHGAHALETSLGRLKRHGGWRAGVTKLVAGFSDGLQAVRTPSDLFATVWYTVIHWFVVALVYYAVTQSFGGNLERLDFLSAVLILAFTMVGSVVQLPAVGGGSQVATFLVLTSLFGVEKEPAAAATIVLWLVTFAVACVGGLPLLVHEGWSMGDLRRLAREERQAEALGGHASIVARNASRQSKEAER